MSSMVNCSPEELPCRTGCGHTFHRECLKAWSYQCVVRGAAFTCPVCRMPLSFDMTGRVESFKQASQRKVREDQQRLEQLNRDMLAERRYRHALLTASGVMRPLGANMRVLSGDSAPMLTHSMTLQNVDLSELVEMSSDSDRDNDLTFIDVDAIRSFMREH